MHSPVPLVWGSLRLVQLIFTFCGYLLHTEASCTQFIVFRSANSLWFQYGLGILYVEVCVSHYRWFLPLHLSASIISYCLQGRNGLCKSTVEAVIQCLSCRILQDEQLWTVLHQLLQWEAATVFQCQNTQRGLYLYGVCMFLSPGR